MRKRMRVQSCPVTEALDEYGRVVRKAGAPVWVQPREWIVGSAPETPMVVLDGLPTFSSTMDHVADGNFSARTHRDARALLESLLRQVDRKVAPAGGTPMASADVR